MAIISSKSTDSATPPHNEVGENNPTPDHLSLKTVAKPGANAEELLGLSSSCQLEEHPKEVLRPQQLDHYIGQTSLKQVLQIAIQAAKARKEPLDHLLLYGPPGLGKTTLSLLLAQEMNTSCKLTSAPALERPRDIVGLLNGLQPGDILFIDEIHRLPRLTEEILYTAMEDFRVDITFGKGKSTRTQSLQIPQFTLVGATTQVGKLTAPLRDRFGIVQRLQFYTVEEVTAIILRSAEHLNTSITPDGAAEIAQRSRGTPRIANRLLKRVRDYVQVKKEAQITQPLAAEALELISVDKLGLNWLDRQLLSTLIDTFNGGPVGLNTIAACLNEDPSTLEAVQEAYLLQIGFLSRTPRGRIATAAAYQHLEKNGN